jgi:putative ABC transport system substrate-binding protein
VRRFERRRFLLAAGALAAAPLARAQKRATMPRLGVPMRGAALAQPPARGRPHRIGLIPEFDDIPNFRSDLSGLFQQLGWREGADFEFIVTGAKYHTYEIEAAAARMVREEPDLILVVATSYASALHRRTRSIPIVMIASGYPVEAGIAHSLARPGKNVTGTTIYAGTGVWAKYLELLRAAKPGLERVGMLMSYTLPGHTREEIEPLYREVAQGAESLGFRVHVVEVPSPDRAEAALAEIEARKPEALLLTSGQGAWTVREKLSGFALRHRLPSVCDFWWVGIEPQPLLIYAPEVTALWRSALSYAVRILRDGARPGDLPIQQPARFELAVNLKTARAIGLTLPASLLLRADRVVE